MGTYLTTNGLQGKTQNEIIAELETEFKTVFGNDIDLDSDSGFGQVIGVFSKFLVQPWDALAELYTGRDPDQATGVPLDKIVAENNITRLAATATQVQNVLLEGNELTVVAAGKKAKRTNDTVEYALDTSVTITKTDAKKGVIEVTTVAAGTYRVTIDAVNYDYAAGGGESKTDILNAIQVLIAAGAWTGTAIVATEQLTLTDLTTAFSFDITGNLSIEETWGYGNFTCTTTGSNPIPATSLIEIVTPVAGWNSVTNPSAGLTGRDLETDEELRLRRKQSVSTGNATDEAIQSNIFDNVDGVTNVIVTSNRTDVTDAESRPPHSFEAVVEGGDDTEIAQEIWRVMPSGIVSYGNTNVTIQDSQGRNQIIYFSRPETVYIFVKVRRSLYSEETYPTDGDNLIKQNIVDWSLLRSNINIDKDVIRQRLGSPVYEVPGIEDIEITLDSSTSLPHSPVYASSNIAINGRQLASFATIRIVVEVLP